MENLYVDESGPFEHPALPDSYSHSDWYAAYTSSNHERRIAKHLVAQAVEYFLPQYNSVRRWKDRRVSLQIPLFPNYIFVRIALRDRLRVLQIPGVVNIVGVNGCPSVIGAEEIRALRKGLALGIRAEPYPYLTAGRHVRVVGGPLAGVEGVLLERKNRTRVVISLGAIRRSVAVEIGVKDIRPIRVLVGIPRKDSSTEC
jgi:transcription antitermination factor NusG